MNFDKRNVAFLACSSLLMVVLGSALSGCGSSSNGTEASGGGPSGKSLHVGFSQLGADSDFRRAETASIQDEAKKRGIDLKFSDAQGKQENQIKALRAFIAQKVDVILVAPIVETGWDPVLKEAKDAGIPVIFVDHRAKVSDESLYLSFIGADLEEEGRRAGKKLVELTGGNATIAVLAGSPGSTPANDREKGFEDAIKGSPGMKIDFNETAEWNRSKAKEVMEACLKTKGKAITALFAHNDDMAMGAIQAIKEAGEKPGVDVKIVSCDGIKDCLKAIAAGDSNATIECNPLLGGVIFDAAEKAAAKKPVDKKIIVPDAEFDKSNAATALPNRKY